MSRLEAIVAACGGILLDGGKRALIPGPDHSAKDRSVSLVETEEGRILVHCFSPKDDWRAVKRALDQKGLLRGSGEASGPASNEPVLQPKSEDRVLRAARLWREGRSIRFSLAASYLQRRSIDDVSDRDALRFHAAMTSVDDRARRPALMAAITGADDALQGVQVTLLSAHGAAKACVVSPRRTIGRLVGGAVRLGAPGDVLIVAEGVESALSAGASLGAPVWAALTAYNLSLFTPPPSVAHLVIAPDADEAGLVAADKLKSRLIETVRVSIEPPPNGANDWNAWACAQRR